MTARRPNISVRSSRARSRNGRRRSRRPGWSSTERAAALIQLERAFDLVREPERGNDDRRARRQFFVALETPVGERLAHRLLNLPLGADAQGLQKLAQAAVEALFVHWLTPRVPARAVGADPYCTC